MDDDRFDPRSFIEEKVAELKDRVGEARAVCATSGGVDSMVCVALGHRALGDRLRSIFIDDGLMRAGEPVQVLNELKTLGIHGELIEAQDEFFEALKGVFDPEEKRKRFRDAFYRVLGRVVRATHASYLIQGTIAADVVETQRGIKTQHNVLEQVGIDPKGYGLTILEPLQELYKPQVREVAKSLGLPESIWARMPFPGPGLAVRIVGEVTRERVEMVRQATRIVEEETALFAPFQAFVVLLSDRATGVLDNQRRFGEIVVVRAVESEDALTASPMQIPWVVLTKIQARICAELPGVTRVLYDLTPKPPATIEYI